MRWQIRQQSLPFIQYQNDVFICKTGGGVMEAHMIKRICKKKFGEVVEITCQPSEPNLGSRYISMIIFQRILLDSRGNTSLMGHSPTNEEMDSDRQLQISPGHCLKWSISIIQDFCQMVG